jgi:hypothetical protein
MTKGESKLSLETLEYVLHLESQRKQRLALMQDVKKMNKNVTQKMEDLAIR